MASSNADFHFLRSPAPTRKALGQPKSTKIKVHRKSPARSFLDPIFDGESEFQRADSSKCDPLYDMSVKRPKNTIFGLLTYKFHYNSELHCSQTAGRSSQAPSSTTPRVSPPSGDFVFFRRGLAIMESFQKRLEDLQLSKYCSNRCHPKRVP